jgi:hypothetical protein
MKIPQTTASVKNFKGGWWMKVFRLSGIVIRNLSKKEWNSVVISDFGA